MPWPFRLLPDPRTIKTIPVALQAGGQIDFPHWTSFLGSRLIQWGSTFEAHAEVSPDHLVVVDNQSATVAKNYGPLTVTFTAEKNSFGQVDYEVRLRIGRRAQMGQGEVDAGWSVGFRGANVAAGMLNRVVTIEANYLDYTVVKGKAGLPATTGTAGVYMRLYPWRVALATLAVGVLIATGYGLYQLIRTTPPIRNPLPTGGR